jgi:hypothetical protein
MCSLVRHGADSIPVEVSMTVFNRRSIWRPYSMRCAPPFPVLCDY